MSDHPAVASAGPAPRAVSAVDPGSSPVAGSRPPLKPWMIGTMVVVGFGVFLIAPSLFRWVAQATHQEAKQAAPVTYGVGQPYRPPPLVTQQDGTPSLPVEKAAVTAMPLPSATPKQNGPDATAVARMSDIGSGGGSAAAPAVRPAAAGGGDDRVRELPSAGNATPLARELTSTAFAASKAVEVANPRFTIEQGTLIPCTQQTAIDTSYPGMVTATIPVDIKGATGDVKLLDAGSRIVGTIEHGITNGLDRAFVVWQQITTPVIYDARGTPHQIRIRVDSPAADEIGQGGLDGDVNHHVWRKLGGVIGLSLIQGGIQAGTAAASGGNRGGSNNLNFSSFSGGSDQLATTLLNSTINIPDVLHRDQGLACTVFIARDLEFSDRYSIRVR